MPLDGVIQLVHSLSYDYIKDPTKYNQVPEDIQIILSSFLRLSGSDPNWPDAFQRARLYNVLLGKSFWRICTTIGREAMVYSEHATEKTEKILRRSFEDGVITLRTYIETQKEANGYDGERRIRTLFENAVRVLKSPEIATLFHMRPVTEDKWPLDGVLSGSGARLIEEISRSLSNKSVGLISFEKFINLQRVAYYGKLTIMGVADTSERWNESANMDKIIGHAYSWWGALIQSVLPVVVDAIAIKAWKDPVFRLALPFIERSLLQTHPSDQIDE